MKILKQMNWTWSAVWVLLWTTPVWAEDTRSAAAEATGGEVVDCFYEQHAAKPACRKDKDASGKTQPDERPLARAPDPSTARVQP